MSKVNTVIVCRDLDYKDHTRSRKELTRDQLLRKIEKDKYGKAMQERDVQKAIQTKI